MAVDEKRNYEATLVLNVHGTEEDLDEIIRNVEQEFRDHKADVTEIRRLEKRKLAYQPRETKVDEGYYVVFVFTNQPSEIEELQETLKLNDRVILSYFQNLGEAQPA